MVVKIGKLISGQQKDRFLETEKENTSSFRFASLLVPSLGYAVCASVISFCSCALCSTGVLGSLAAARMDM